MSFSERGGHRPLPPPRVIRDQAPDRLRLLVLEILKYNRTTLAAYRRVCNYLHVFADPELWGEEPASRRLQSMVREMEWYQVFDVLEMGAESTDVENVNECLQACGLAFEMEPDTTIVDWEPEAKEFELAGSEHEAVATLTGRFEPVRVQYERALTALTARPSDPELAIGEALNALEGVVTILTGKKSLAAGLDFLNAGKQPWNQALATSLKALHGYASQVPGARHGRHEPSDVEIEEARCVVRCAGAAIVMITSQQRDQF